MIMAKEKLTHKQEITARREKAAQLLSERKKQEKRQKIATWSTFGVIVAAAIAVIVFIVVSSNQQKLDVSETSPNALSTNGVILTSQTEVATGEGYDLELGKPAKSEDVLKDSTVPNVEIFLDYDCPHCKEFEDMSSNYLNSLLDEGTATVEYKPIVVIGSNLSISGGNAAACVAEYAPDRFNDLHTKLFEMNGQQNVSVSKTVKSLNIAGEAGEQVQKCVSSKVYSNWLDKATAEAMSKTDKDGKPVVTGTPTILIDGVKYPYSPDQFTTFMDMVLESGLSVEEVIATTDAAQSQK